MHNSKLKSNLSSIRESVEGNLSLSKESLVQCVVPPTTSADPSDLQPVPQGITSIEMIMVISVLIGAIVDLMAIANRLKVLVALIRKKSNLKQKR